MTFANRIDFKCSYHVDTHTHTHTHIHTHTHTHTQENSGYVNLFDCGSHFIHTYVKHHTVHFKHLVFVKTSKKPCCI